MVELGSIYGTNIGDSNTLVIDFSNVDICGNLNVGGTFTSTIESTLDNESIVPQNVFQPLVPPGAVMSFATKGAPQGWLECSGQILSRSSYQNLFDVIGTTWDTGVGINDFAIPNLNTGYFIRGGDVDGILKLDSTKKPSGFSATTGSSGVHSHAIEHANGGSEGTRLGRGAVYNNTNGASIQHIGTLNAGSHNHTVNVNGWDTETAPKHVVLLYCIKY